MLQTEQHVSKEPGKRFRLDDRLRRVLHGGASALLSRGVGCIRQITPESVLAAVQVVAAEEVLL